MRLLRNLDELTPELGGGAVTIGNFDGVHRGHARLLQRLCDHARRVGGPATVFTFDPHPVRLLRPEAAPPPLTWAERKAELLADWGVEAMIAYPTDEQLLSLTPHEFFQQVICGLLAARAVVEGPNFRFGRGRGGDVHLLGELCQAAGIALEIVPPLMVGDEYVSSSRVRGLIQQGDVAAARDLLTRPYRIRGLVTHGARRGAGLGFPTANLEGVDTLLPPPGVYAGRAGEPRGTWPAAVHIGPNPTFGEHAVKLEVHLIGYQGLLYGEPLEVDFLTRLRDIRPFPSVDQLKSQLQRDVQTCREIAERFPD